MYNSHREDLIKVINSFLNSKLNFEKCLYLVDNSPANDLIDIIEHPNVIYITKQSNLGFGKAHNLAIKKAIEQNAKYHLVLNPDIYFEENVLAELIKYMDENPIVGNIMPKIVYPNNKIQYVCKLLPTPMDLILRRFIPFKSWKNKRNEKYELRISGYDKIMNIPYLSGCFMLLRVDVLKEIGLFDENIFMYIEDTDLNRRIHRKYKTIFYPFVKVVHKYQKESYKSKRLLRIHIQSAIYYFNKYGWIIDKERTKYNKEILKYITQKVVKTNKDD